MHHAVAHWNLLARYVLGECSAEEEEAVRQWIAAESRRGAEVELMQQASAFARELPSADEIDAMWAKMADALEPAQDAQHRGKRRAAPVLAPVVAPLSTRLSTARRARWRWMKLIAAAAVLAVAVGGGSALWSRLDDRRRAPESRVAEQEFRTLRGERALITLLDGTRVVLAPGSQMRVAIGESGRREVVLDGEAVFDVVHISSRPFIVRAGGAFTEDLGTRFGVRAYSGESARVVVAEGRVAVRDTLGNAGTAVLEARDLAWVNGSSRVIVERAVDPESYLSWTTGQLVFHRARLADAVAQLERWFDVHVIVEDSSLLTTAVNLSFNNDDIDYVLRALALSLDVHAERRGRLIYLRGRD